MKKNIFTILAFAALLLGMTSCSDKDNDDNNPVDVSAMEQELIGLWWDEFEYADVTETGEPFTRALLAVEVDDDHTGCLYLGVFNDDSDEPLAVYGGFDDAGFTWQVLPNGNILLGDPESEETYELSSRSRAGGDSYGNDMTNVDNTNMNYNNGSVTVNNGDYSGTLNKANSTQQTDILNKFRANIQSNVDLGMGGDAPKDFTENDIR